MTKQQIIILNRLMADAKRIKKQMEETTSMKNSPHGYHLLENDLKEKLNKIRQMDFLYLSKSNLIEFLCLCSSHRPLEPWQLLTDLKIRRDARATALLTEKIEERASKVDLRLEALRGE